MQVEAPKVNCKCPECKGSGKLVKLWPLYVISMPHELAWQRFTCWRCKGTGELPADDPYVRRNYVEPSKPWSHVASIWFWLFAGATVFVIVLLFIP